MDPRSVKAILCPRGPDNLATQQDPDHFSLAEDHDALFTGAVIYMQYNIQSSFKFSLHPPCADRPPRFLVISRCMTHPAVTHGSMGDSGFSGTGWFAAGGHR